MLNHVVLMKFRPDTTDAAIDNLERMLDDLPNHIVQIHTYEFGRDVIRSDRSYDFAIVSLFANEVALQAYQEHPEHQNVVSLLKQICESILTVDFYGTDAASLKDMDRPDPLLAGFDDQPG